LVASVVSPLLSSFFVSSVFQDTTELVFGLIMLAAVKNGDVKKWLS